MESKAKLFGHAVHPMLIVFPLGLLATAVIFERDRCPAGPADRLAGRRVGGAAWGRRGRRGKSGCAELPLR